MNKAVFLDRDGVLNEEIGDYVWTLDQFKIVDGIIEILKKLKGEGYKLLVITNQGGIAKGVYGHDDVKKMHDYFQEQSDHVIDEYYYSPTHPKVPESLSHPMVRKPSPVMFEKAIADHNVDPHQSWMIGDKERDLIPAKALGMKTIRIFLEGYFEEGEKTIGDHSVSEVKAIEDILFS
ncbi:MAG: D-glycero-alpha-D-manno-heptose-1,7-bisphosphate 7-phosphatase [Ekhidna sp.]